MSITSTKASRWQRMTPDEKLVIKIFTPVTLLCLALTLLTGYTSFASMYGPTTTGLITHSMLDKKEDCFTFEYQYQVNGQGYRGHNIDGFTYHGLKGCYVGTETVSTFWEGPLAQGKEVTVHYLEDYPSVATLHPEIGLTFFIPLLLSLAGAAAVIGLYLKGLAK